MIILKTLTWDNAFSYGKGNKIDFSANPITQLVGKNGHGKSSIALVLEEILFNKNSKGIKKADILNRHIKDKSYSISLTFHKDGEEYEIKSSRGSTQTVSFFKGGENISAHTSTATLKLIEQVIGIDHKTFAQLVYQSSAGSLEFLTATDTNRKKFLIDLLNLGKYTEAFEVFKAAAKKVSEEVVSIESSIKTVKAWIDKHDRSTLLERMATVEVPEYDPTLEQSLKDLEAQLATINATNKTITKNNQYISNRDSLDASVVSKTLLAPQDTKKQVAEVGEHTKTVKDANAFIAKIAKLNGVCPTCLQEVDRPKLDELIAEQEALKNAAEKAIVALNKFIDEQALIKKEHDKVKKIQEEYEQYHGLIDPDLPVELLDADTLKVKILGLDDEISAAKKAIKAAQDENSKATAHNAKMEMLEEQLAQMNQDLAKKSEELNVVGEQLNYLQILQKTFSTSGLVAYKIECLVKDLEDLVNEYLADLSDGRFQITFVINASDKLNVVVTDNGKDIDMLALSGGERARVNTATLLAIRKLMQSLSATRINLLILDETIDALDVEGKEKLIEVLIKEEHLNTFLVSHGFSHPLLEKITVIKEHNISRIE